MNKGPSICRHLVFSVCDLQPFMVIAHVAERRVLLVTDVNVRFGYCDVEDRSGRSGFLADPLTCRVLQACTSLSEGRKAFQRLWDLS